MNEIDRRPPERLSSRPAHGCPPAGNCIQLTTPYQAAGDIGVAVPPAPAVGRDPRPCRRDARLPRYCQACRSGWLRYEACRPTCWPDRIVLREARFRTVVREPRRKLTAHREGGPLLPAPCPFLSVTLQRIRRIPTALLPPLSAEG